VVGNGREGRRREGRGGEGKGGQGRGISPPPPQNIFGLTPLGTCLRCINGTTPLHGTDLPAGSGGAPVGVWSPPEAETHFRFL